MMSLISGTLIKQRLRAELEMLVEKYDGPIIRKRDGGRVILICCLCKSRRYLDVAHALQFKPCCLRCGAEMKIAW